MSKRLSRSEHRPASVAPSADHATRNLGSASSIPEQAEQPSPDRGSIRARLLTVPGAVAYSGYTRTGIYAALAAGEIQARKIGRRTLIEVASLDAFINRAPVAQFGSKRSST